MRIGIVPHLNPSGGGVYQYSITMLRVLGEWKEEVCEDEFIVFASQARDATFRSLNGGKWTFQPLFLPQPRSLQKEVLELMRGVVGEGPHREVWRWLRRQLQRSPQYNPDLVQPRPDMTQWFHRCEVDLMFYLAPDTLSFETGIPYVMAIGDLQHRLQPEFPEVSANGEWEWREYLFRNGARYATLLLADSEIGKEDILNFYGPYGVTPDRVKVLPFLPACYLSDDISASERDRVRTTYLLPERYLFYPAQFWPHKNHARIVHALAALKQEHGLKIPVVFCGSYTGEIRERTFHDVMSLSSKLGIEKQINYLGYVRDEDMSGLYAEAVALVMPTFFGPTNIPVVEAWAFGCPVLTSDIRGIREQVQQAGILADPRSVEAIADGIYRLWTDKGLVRSLTELGRQRLASYTSDDYRQRLVAIIQEAKARICEQRLQTA